MSPYHASPRKRQTKNPKFFLFDPGVKRALERTLTVPLLPRTYAFGEAFEHWVTLEIHKRNEYLKRDYRLSYLRTHDGAEIDLVIERPGKGVALVEIKSTEKIQPNLVKHLQAFLPELPKAEAFLFSLDPVSQKIGAVRCLHWNEGLKALGL